ncbi:hypothetical protein ACJX0J_010146 [Zea mays]
MSLWGQFLAGVFLQDYVMPFLLNLQESVESLSLIGDKLCFSYQIIKIDESLGPIYKDTEIQCYGFGTESYGVLLNLQQNIILVFSSLLMIFVLRERATSLLSTSNFSDFFGWDESNAGLSYKN